MLVVIEQMSGHVTRSSFLWKNWPLLSSFPCCKRLKVPFDKGSNNWERKGNINEFDGRNTGFPISTNYKQYFSRIAYVDDDPSIKRYLRD